jgi:hypothetical protein
MPEAEERDVVDRQRPSAQLATNEYRGADVNAVGQRCPNCRLTRPTPSIGDTVYDERFAGRVPVRPG